MPNVDSVAKAAQRHAFGALIRTEGWCLYMARLLTVLWNIERGEGSPDYSEHQRSKLMGQREQILMDIGYVYKEAGEENPLEFERKAVLARLTMLQHTSVPADHGLPEQEEKVEIPRRSSRSFVGGVE